MTYLVQDTQAAIPKYCSLKIKKSLVSSKCQLIELINTSEYETK